MFILVPTYLSGCEGENNPAQGENIHGQGVNTTVVRENV